MNDRKPKKMNSKSTSNTLQKVLKTSNKYILLSTLILLLLATGAIAQNIPSYLPNNGLVGWWPFNGNANDESGNGNDGEVNGTSWTNDRFEFVNSALENGSVVIPYNNSIQLSSSFSISAWFLPWGIVSPSQIISKWDNNGNQVFRLYIQNFELGAAINNGISSEVVESNSCSICTDGSWYHIVLTFQYPNLVTLFVNGNLSQTTILQNSGLNNAQIPITIGDSFSYPFDDIALYDRAITPEEITALYTGEPLIPTNINRPLSDNTNNIKVFPNPTGSNLTIDIGNFALMNGYQLRVKNSLGQQVFQTNINQESETLTLNNWGGNGLYFVHVIDPQGNTIDIRKIVLQ